MANHFRVELQLFRGPLDLLLYLVRKQELDVVELPIAQVAEQYLGFLEGAQQLDVDMVGDFLELSSTLVEIKSRMVLPHAGEEETEVDDRRQDLVERLIEYKKYRDAASVLEERSRAWLERFPRLAAEAEPADMPPAAQPIHELELWDLVSAHDRLMRDRRKQPQESIVYDDTPIHVFMERIRERLSAHERLAFSDLLEPKMHKSTLVGIFLAILELIRKRAAVAYQDDRFGEIWLADRDAHERE